MRRQGVSLLGTVCIALANGCSRAEVDLARFYDYFEANGWSCVDDLAHADLVVISACRFDEATETASRALLALAAGERRADSRMFVIGCMASDEEHIAHLNEVERVSPRENERMDELIGAAVPLTDVADPDWIEPSVERAKNVFSNAARHADERALTKVARRVFVASGVRARLARSGNRSGEAFIHPDDGCCTIRVARGCLGECSYCVIRRSHGTLHSKPLDEILSHFDERLAAGDREFRLLAQDLGAYGQDIGTSITDLLREMLSRDGDFRLTLIDFDARWFVRYADTLIPLLVANAHRVKHLAMPLQSGSERVLALMRRGHTVAEARDALLRLRAAAPEILLATHAMVGFPTETEEDFQDTVELLETVGFDRVDVFDYSERPGTEASRMSDKVPTRELESRSRRLRRRFVGFVPSVEYAVRNAVRRWG